MSPMSTLSLKTAKKPSQTLINISRELGENVRVQEGARAQKALADCEIAIYQGPQSARLMSLCLTRIPYTFIFQKHTLFLGFYSSGALRLSVMVLKA